MQPDVEGSEQKVKFYTSPARGHARILEHVQRDGKQETSTCAATASVRFVIRGGSRCARGARSWRGCWESGAERAKLYGSSAIPALWAMLGDIAWAPV
jgi:hypothetical protein